MDNPTKPIRWKLHLPSPPSVVFDVLDSDEGRATFWAESAVEHHGVIRFRFINGKEHEARVLRREPPLLFEIEYFGATARFDLASDGSGGTDLTLTHAGVPEEEWIETHAGWLNVLLPLKASLLASIDLRNHDPNRTWDDGYADQ